MSVTFLWMAEGRCKTYSYDFFFSSEEDTEKQRREKYAKAKLLCGICDVSMECRRYALDNDISEGVWGGLTPYQRREIRQGRAA